MNKREADRVARLRPTFEALRAAIAQRRRLAAGGHISRVNPAMTVQQACDIFEASIQGRPNGERVGDSAREILLARNIL